MYTIRKRFQFSAAHSLSGLPAEHPCGRVHGHNYTVTLELSASALTGPGFVRDYRALAPFKKFLDAHFDHRNLNDILPFEPTAENLAEYLYGVTSEAFNGNGVRVSAVIVQETETTWAEYRT